MGKNAAIYIAKSYFINCSTSFDSSSEGYGGAIAVDANKASCSLIIDNCSFYNNSARFSAGAIYLNSAR